MFLYHTTIKRRLLCPFLAVLMLVALTGCNAVQSYRTENSMITDTDFYFDTVVTLTLYDTDDSSILDDCFQEMARYESLLSRTREGSDIWKINHSHGEAVEVSDSTIELLKLALQYSKRSEGVFDPTISSVVSLWNFTENPEKLLPDQKEIDEALSHVDYRNIQIDGNTVTLLDPAASLDLGGIAKGYIADQLKAFLTDKGITSALINLGGNNLALGTKPNKQPWKIGIQKPFGKTSELVTVLSVDGQSVVTSGNYERYFEKDGQIYHHILDTKTGYPIQNHLQGVTILSDSSAEGDALSTTCFALGLEKGMELIETLPNVEALFITDDGALHRSSNFPN